MVPIYTSTDWPKPEVWGCTEGFFLMVFIYFYLFKSLKYLEKSCLKLYISKCKGFRTAV